MGAETCSLVRLAWSLQPTLPALALCPRRPGSQTSAWPRGWPPLLPAVLPRVRVRTCLRTREAQEVQGAWACVPVSESLLGGDRVTGVPLIFIMGNSDIQNRENLSSSFYSEEDLGLPGPLTASPPSPARVLSLGQPGLSLISIPRSPLPQVLPEGSETSSGQGGPRGKGSCGRPVPAAWGWCPRPAHAPPCPGPSDVPLLLVGQHGLRDGQLVGTVGTCDVLCDPRHDVGRVLRCTRRPGRVRECHTPLPPHVLPPGRPGPSPGAVAMLGAAEGPLCPHSFSESLGALAWGPSGQPALMAAGIPGQPFLAGRPQASPVLWASSLLNRSLQARSWKKLL